MRINVAFFFLLFIGIINVRAAKNGSRKLQDTPSNFIVFQPDDFEFFEDWTPPPHIRPRFVVDFPDSGLPHLERLRRDGVEMMQAYTASSTCGTSRYSTMTGRYPSRSSFGRNRNNIQNNEIAEFVIPKTKLEDIDDVVDGSDCSDNNIAALLQKNGYRTGVVGKWHLSTGSNTNSYGEIQSQIGLCGFDFVEAIYSENLGEGWHDGTFSHNNEYVMAKAIEFIQEASLAQQEFFLYVNPTAPHSSGSVSEALTDFPCTATPEGELDAEPVVPVMTEGSSCTAYRQTIFDRAGQGNTDNKVLGSIWVDDGIGAILQTLEDQGLLDNTFFLFQMDHGQEGKGSLYEQGIRLAQFVHFPSANLAGEYQGLVSTIDIGPTILDYAGIDENSPGYYEMDGESWRDAVEAGEEPSAEGRCLYFELDFDRAVRCGCYKYMALNSNTADGTADFGDRYGLATDSEFLVNLCTNEDDNTYETSDNMEVNPIINNDLLIELKAQQQCHNERTRTTEQPQYTDCIDSTLTPTITPAETESGLCLSGDTTVSVREMDGKLKKRYLKDLEIGDEILVDSGSDDMNILPVYEEVYAFGHRNPYEEAHFVRIETSSTTLEITAEHLLYKKNGVRGTDSNSVPGPILPVRADTVRIGDYLVVATTETHASMVTNITSVRKQGLYSPLTHGGQFIANGLMVSSYTAVNFLPVGVSYHTAIHLAAAPLRLLRGLTLCQESINDQGRLLLVDLADTIARTWLKPWEGMIIFWLAGFFFVPLFGIEQILWQIGIIKQCFCCSIVILLIIAIIVTFQRYPTKNGANGTIYRKWIFIA